MEKKKTHAHLGMRKPFSVTVTFSGGLPFWGWSQAITLHLPLLLGEHPDASHKLNFCMRFDMSGASFNLPKSQKQNTDLVLSPEKPYRTSIPSETWSTLEQTWSKWFPNSQEKYDHTLNDLGYVSKVWTPIDLQQICRKSRFKHVKLFSNFFGFPLTHVSQNSGPRRFGE